MRNADERNKLLGQIAELEQGSVNYFDVEKEFFLITSSNLSEVKTRFYGYSIQADGIYEDDNLTPEAVKNLDGRGCYVYVEAREGQITIKQDLNGSWGIYLFRHGDYFALSNSFFRLLDHVKFLYPLTVNRDYCHYLMVNNLTSHAYSETAVNEIQLVDRNAVLHIDSEKNLRIELIDYRENTVPLDSEEAMATLDSWFEFWCKVFHGVTQHTEFFTADLTGGFDSRLSFIPLLHSGIDYKKVSLNSFTARKYMRDYQIASRIAARYGLELNQPFSNERFLNYSLMDSLNIDLYYRQTFKKVPDCITQKPVDRNFVINGYAGETIRRYWHMSPKKFAESQVLRLTQYPLALAEELSHSIKNIVDSACRAVCEKYKIEDPDSIDIPQYLYQETRCRSHFGKNMVGSYFKNSIMISPLLDPKLRTLRLNADECPDANLLMAVIFTRYIPELLNFPFAGKHSVNPETVDFARKLNERFPRRTTTDTDDRVWGRFNLQPRDILAEKILDSGYNNKKIPEQLPRRFLRAVFDSSKTYGLFTAYFDAELYNHAANFYDTGTGLLDKYSNSIYGIARVLEDVEISRRNHPLYCDTKRFIEEDFAQIHVPAPVKPIK